jgi:beta-lactamase regulating signal transducer with metallopeptidase domain
MVSTYTLFSTFAVHHLIIGGLLLLLLSLSFRFIKPSAEVKSWLWLTAFLVSTLVPFSAFIPEAQTAATFKVTEKIQKLPVAGSDVAASVISVSGQAEQQLWHMPEELVFKGMILLSLFVAVWLLGSLWRFFSIFKSFINTRQVVAKAVALPDLSEQNYPVAMSQYTSTPMVVGLFRPVVILPENIVDALDETQLKPIIMHEIAHIKRGDMWFSLLQELLAVVFWWSPVMRQFNNHIHINRELACDYRAIKALDSAKAYAQSLLECAKIMVRNRQNLLAVGLFSKKKELSKRIDAALSYGFRS